MNKTKTIVNDKQQTIRYLTDLMATIQAAHYKGRLHDSPLRVHENGESGISIDLYNFEGDGKPVCEGLTFNWNNRKELQRAFCICYDPDWEENNLYILCYDDETTECDDYDALPEELPMSLLQAIARWLEQEMKPAERKKAEPATPNDIITLWTDWCMDYDDENLWLDYMTSHTKAHCNRQHLQEKWNRCYEKYGNKAAMTMFWRELDRDNRDILTEYITTKYNQNN